jgi:DNA polymerase
MFVGEAPGETEDRVGRPFVGRAGEKLDEIIRAMGLSRSAVYIANVLKARPPDNRTPLQHEVEACGPWLCKQIAIVKPRVIVTLGGPATKLLLKVDQGITRMRGIWATYQDGEIRIPVMPTFHPAYLLRNYTAETRRQVWEDMCKVIELLGLDRSR